MTSASSTPPSPEALPPTPSTQPGGNLVRRVAMVLVPVHLTASIAALSTTPSVATVGVVANLALFGAALIVFLAAFGLAASRSRHEAVWFGGAFLLTGDSVARSDRRLFHTIVLAQIVTAFVVAGIRPFTSAAFAVLAVLASFSLMAWFGSRYGRFPARTASR